MPLNWAPIFFFFFGALLLGIWDLNFLARDSYAPGSGFPTTGLPGKSHLG